MPRRRSGAASRPARCAIAPRLLRFVVGPDGDVVPDVDERLPGRGLWLTPRRDIVDRAVAKRLSRAPRGGRCRCRPTSRIGSKHLLARRCCRLARACQTGRLGRCRVRPGLRRGAAWASRPAAVRSGRRGRRPAKAGRAGARPAVRRGPDRGRARRGVRPRPDRARGGGRRKAVPAAAGRSGEACRAARRRARRRRAERRSMTSLSAGSSGAREGRYRSA